MFRVAIVRQAREGSIGFDVVSSFATKKEAEKDLANLPEGTYDIISFLERGIVVQSKQQLVVNEVVRGQTTIKRPRSVEE